MSNASLTFAEPGRSGAMRPQLLFALATSRAVVGALYPHIELLALIWQLVYRPGDMRSTMFRR
jgi:hypothetical protein